MQILTTLQTFTRKPTFKLFKIIFVICSIYFFMMGTGLIFFPRFLIRGLSESDANPIIIGMLRGAGGSILPYSLLYILILLNPFKRIWALYIILLANVIAVTLDLGSVILEEYKLSYAMIDLPIEIMSIIGVAIIWFKKRYISIDKQCETWFKGLRSYS
jgi:hypothetical protein